jgi:uncharacterized protein
MKEYFRWSLHQLFLMYFQRSRFRHEVEAPILDDTKITQEAYFYMLKMLPWMIAFVVCGNLLVGHLFGMIGFNYRWFGSWTGAVIGVGSSALMGMMVGMAFGVGLSVGLSTMCSVSAGLPIDVTLGMAGGLVVGIALGVASGMAISMMFGVGVDVKFLVAGVFWFSVAFSVPLGLMYDVVSGVVCGVAFPLTFLLIYCRLYAYPLDVCLSIVAWALRKRLQGVGRAWRFCPVAWNEFIYLPLPYAGRLLTLLAQEDREEGIRQIAFVAAERKLQRRVALVALQEVTYDDLQANALSEVMHVAEKLDWMKDAPMELPTAIQAALPRFGRISELIGQYDLLNSSYRKRETLQRARTELEALQKSLIVTRSRTAEKFLWIANQWATLLEAEWKTVEALSATKEIPNPFRHGPPVPETEQNVFTGRRDITVQIEANILNAAQAPTLLLHGARRMGKSSLLNQLPRLLGPDFAPAVVDCQSAAVTESQAALLRYLSRAVSEGLRRRRVTLEALSAAKLEREPFGVFDEWLDEVERKLPQGMRVLLCLDEYERLQETLDAGWGGKFLDMLRNTLQHRSRIVMMFTGVRSFSELGPAWTDRFLSTRRVRVSFLTEEEVKPLLTRPIPEFDMTYAAGALEAVMRETHGQPFLTQAVAYELVQYLNELQRREATEADVEVAIGRALMSGDAYFANVWSDAGEGGQAVLRAVACGATPPPSPRETAWLREHDVLDANGAFLVPMVERWVRADSERGN